MADLHPEVLKLIEAGPRQWWNKDGTLVTRQETPEEFARRIAALAVQLEREECAKIANDMDVPDDQFGVGLAAASAIRRRGKP